MAYCGYADYLIVVIFITRVILFLFLAVLALLILINERVVLISVKIVNLVFYADLEFLFNIYKYILI